MKSNSCGQPDSSSSSTQCASSAAAQFKVPALPTRRQNSPGTVQQPQPQQQQQPQPAAELQQQQRRHGAPKRRATPQVWDHGPICITPAAPPNSSMHGEACCDATLLPCWCPLSGKRLKADPQPEAAGAAAAVSTAALQQHLEACDASQAAANVSNSSMPRASSSLARSSSTSGLQEQQQQQEGAAKAVLGPGLPLGRAAFSSARRDAIEDLQRSMHQDPSSKPAADVLLFHKATQLPVVSWTGPIKHKASGQVVEICSLTLQVCGGAVGAAGKAAASDRCLCVVPLPLLCCSQHALLLCSCGLVALHLV